MQAAGRLAGRWASWSKINETSGLTTIESPPIKRELIIYVKDFPEAVYEIKTTELPSSTFLIV